MEENIKIVLKQDKLDSLKVYADLLNKDINTMLDEALERYFKVEKERIIDKEESATNLDYDEFWKGVDFDD
ncbi:MAG: Unknown protein [uncultured Sulfurovum sp.]|uniref:CopG family transcriptional regulator n=1 Tax=uncultured Sulfurovum sp. TaxID=269237 RepID=A0A6S6S7K2_9BACT|nr:MAG: Unknown protein [uncultured Sulfurovum sp.]